LAGCGFPTGHERLLLVALLFPYERDTTRFLISCNKHCEIRLTLAQSRHWIVRLQSMK
jgi:hypothetical protein